MANLVAEALLCFGISHPREIKEMETGRMMRLNVARLFYLVIWVSRPVRASSAFWKLKGHIVTLNPLASITGSLVNAVWWLTSNSSNPIFHLYLSHSHHSSKQTV